MVGLLSLALTSKWAVAQEADSGAQPEAGAVAPTADASAGSATTDDKSATPAASDSSAVTAENPVAEQPPEPEQEIAFKNLPYAVRVSVAFASRALPRQPQRDAAVRSVRYAVTRMYGRLWDVEVEQNTWLAPAGRRHLEWLDTADMLTRYPEQRVHKAFLITVETSGPTFIVSCREYDSRIQELTPVGSRRTRDIRDIGTVATELMRDLFRPCVLYVRRYLDEDGRSLMEMQVQGGELIPPDPTAEQVIENDVLRPFVRYMDRRDPTKLSQLLRLDLTYIRVLEVDRDNAPGLIQGFFLSHSPTSPFSRKGRKVQHLAVRQRPAADHSKVRMVLQGRPDRPLVSHRASLAYQLHWKDPEDGPQTQLVSDRNGEVVIAARENHPTFWIRVYSGASLLARVPYAPGIVPSDTIELPDDSIRLAVEGEIQLLADELIDAIALRAVLIARARKAAENRDPESLETLLARYQAVPEKEYFLQRIKSIESPAVALAEQRRMSPKRINDLCSGLETTVTGFFSDQKRRETQAQIQQFRIDVEKAPSTAGL